MFYGDLTHIIFLFVLNYFIIFKAEITSQIQTQI